MTVRPIRTGVFVGCLGILANGLGRWLLYHSWMALNGFGLIVMLLHGLALGGIAATVRWYCDRENRRNQIRYRYIAECNHHIRNALQTIVMKDKDLMTEVERIEYVLEELLPRVGATKDKATSRTVDTAYKPNRIR